MPLSSCRGAWAPITLTAWFGLVCLMLMAAHAFDPYRVLGIHPDATASEVKRAYHRLSLQFHPDKNPTKEAEDMFLLLSKAYEILSDGDRRRNFDNAGQDSGPSGPGKRSSSSLDSDMPKDYSVHWKGGEFYFSHRPPAKEKRTAAQDVTATVELSMEQVYQGAKAEVSYQRKVTCPICKGSGAHHPHHVVRCPVCRGTGFWNSMHVDGDVVHMLNHTCGECDGHGIQIEETCKHCGGAKTVMEQAEVEVSIPPGAAEGFSISLPGRGDVEPGLTPGSVTVSLRSLAHDNYTRQGNDLVAHLNITLFDALLGFETNMTSLDNRTVLVVHNAVSSPGAFVTVQGEGMPVPGSPGMFGDLRVMMNIKFPEKLTDAQKQLLRSVLDEQALKTLEAQIRRRSVIEGMTSAPAGFGDADISNPDGTYRETGAVVLLVEQPIKTDGIITEWSFKALSAGTVFCSVWRREEGNTYTQMGRTELGLPSPGGFAVPLEPHQQIRVKEGDILGLWSDTPGIFGFSSTEDSGKKPSIYSAQYDGMPNTGDSAVFPKPMAHKFSLRAKVKPFIVLFSEEGCGGQSYTFPTFEGDMCHGNPEFSEGVRVNDNARAVAVPPNTAVEFFPDCGTMNAVLATADNRGVGQARCLNIPHGTSHLRVIQ